MLVHVPTSMLAQKFENGDMYYNLLPFVNTFCANYSKIVKNHLHMPVWRCHRKLISDNLPLTATAISKLKMCAFFVCA